MKKVMAVFLLLLCSACLTGCLEQISLTDRESEIIAEEAARVLLKHDKYYKEKLATPTPTVTPRPTRIPSVSPTPTAQPDSADNGSGEENVTPSVTPGVNEIANAELTELVGVENIELEYMSFEVFDNYTNGFSSIEAIDDKHQLMVVTMRVNNTSNKPVLLDVLPLKLEFVMDVNVGTRISPRWSILTNDFQFLSANVEENGYFDCVLVFDVNRGFEPETMSLFVMKNEKTVIIKLK